MEGILAHGEAECKGKVRHEANISPYAKKQLDILGIMGRRVVPHDLKGKVDKTRKALVELAQREIARKLSQGISETQIAKMIGVADGQPSRLARGERGAIRPQLVTLLKIRHALDVDDMELCQALGIKHAEAMKKLLPLLKEEFEAMADLPEEKIRTIKNLVRAYISSS